MSPSLGQLNSLTELNLLTNPIGDIPFDLGGLSRLIKLYLDHTKIQSLGDNFGALTSITHLSVTESEVRTIGQNVFGHLKNLKELNLRKNHIPEIPYNFSFSFSDQKGFTKDSREVLTRTKRRKCE